MSCISTEADATEQFGRLPLQPGISPWIRVKMAMETPHIFRRHIHLEGYVPSIKRAYKTNEWPRTEPRLLKQN
jgi:hypothetical protein